MSDLDGRLSCPRVAIERQETVASVGVEGRLHRAGSASIEASSDSRTRRRVSGVPSPSVTSLRKSSRHRVAVAELSRLEQVLGAGGEGPADAADLPVRLEREATLLPPVERAR